MPTRREFVAAAGAAGFAVGTHSAASRAQGRGTLILFQGDSITDCNRNRDDASPNHAGALGTGYPLLAAAALLREHPERSFSFLNRGVSGNRIPDLAERWRPDVLDLRPDVLSILIGVNDLWHKLMGRSQGTVEEYESGYGALLDQARVSLPGVQIVVLEPFVLRTGAVTDAWFPEFDQRRAAAARVARRAGARFLELQRMFDALVRRAPPAYWAADGVHPTPAGHSAIARMWMDSVRL